MWVSGSLWLAFGWLCAVGNVATATWCADLVASGDQSVGISAVEDASCGSGGLGCFQSGQCRYCQQTETAQSASYLACSSFGAAASPITTPSPVPASTDASMASSCSTIVQQSGLADVSYVTETGCSVASPTLSGCQSLTSCRLCRNAKNEATQYLTSCQVLQTSATETTMQSISFQTDDGVQY
ncbi:hypothetical protein BBJ28_00017981 [Nothophytophthora sp. Chile5]|nr:hypothetical protein BBJ28_00017981 [Nothophytophthora sp. Chile5]